MKKIIFPLKKNIVPLSEHSANVVFKNSLNINLIFAHDFNYNYSFLNHFTESSSNLYYFDTFVKPILEKYIPLEYFKSDDNEVFQYIENIARFIYDESNNNENKFKYIENAFQTFNRSVDNSFTYSCNNNDNHIIYTHPVYFPYQQQYNNSYNYNIEFV